MKYLLYRVDWASPSLSNKKMSLDIGVALAWLTARTLVVYGNQSLGQAADSKYQGSVKPTVLDLFEVPVNCVSELELIDRLPSLSLRVCRWPQFHNTVFYFPHDIARNNAEFQNFCNGRQHLITIDEDLNAFDVLHVDTRTFGLYSYFFYLSQATRVQLNRIMAQVVAKAPYQEFAGQLSKHLGTYNAIHVRRSDSLNARTFPRNSVVTPEEIIDNMTTVMPRNETLVICTDQSEDAKFFHAFSERYRGAVFLDRLILEDPKWRKQFEQLPFASDAVLALVTQLVASRAQVFAGTLCSTFTAMIHRLRGFERPDAPFLYLFDQYPGCAPFSNCEYTPTRAGHFSWNRYSYPLQPDLYAWFREWPEAVVVPVYSKI